MLKIKRIFVFVVCIILFCIVQTAFGSNKVENASIKVIVDGSKLEFEVQPIMVNGKVMAELRTLTEKVDGKIDCNQETKTVTISDFLGNEATIQIGNKKAYVNDKEIYLDLEPQIVDNRTFIPLRSFSAYMGG